MEHHDIYDFLRNPGLTILHMCGSKGMSLSKLAEYADLSNSQVSKIVNGKSDPKLSTLKKIAAVFELLR